MKELFKINSACDRFEFFQRSMMLFVLQLVFALTFWTLTTYTGIKNMLWLIPLFLIFVELPLLYIYFVQVYVGLNIPEYRPQKEEDLRDSRR